MRTHFAGLVSRAALIGGAAAVFLAPGALAAAANSGELRAVGLIEIHKDGRVHTRTLGWLSHKPPIAFQA